FILIFFRIVLQFLMRHHNPASLFSVYTVKKQMVKRAYIFARFTIAAGVVLYLILRADIPVMLVPVNIPARAVQFALKLGALAGTHVSVQPVISQIRSDPRLLRFKPVGLAASQFSAANSLIDSLSLLIETPVDYRRIGH